MSWEYWLIIVMTVVGFFGVWEHGKIINRHADEIARIKNVLKKNGIVVDWHDSSRDL